MLDTGAIPCCLASRCVLGSQKLSHVTRESYTGPAIFDASGNQVSHDFVINTSLRIGVPQVDVLQQFVVIKDLPFACILRGDFLKKLQTYEVSNLDNVILLNKSSKVSFTTVPPFINTDTLQFITTGKCRLKPQETKEIDVRVTGP